MMRWIALGLAGLVAMACAAGAAEVKPRLIVVSDIGNEPDDSESFVRLLLYTNQIDAEGFVASTSTWQREIIHPELMRERIAAYGQVLKNLRVHDKGFPDAAKLMALVKSGQPHYGMSHVGDGCDTEGSGWIIAEADKPDPRPLWVTLWGGAADLAQALYHVRATRTPEQVKAFVAKLRVYSISDQDDAGPWARYNFPELFWITSIHAFSNYHLAEWQGISGELIVPFPGADRSLISNEWLEKNIRRGPLGALYPPWQFAMEGDTPSFLNLIARGLTDTEHPEWGGWGGRYNKVAPQYGLFSDTLDTVIGLDGERHISNHASIWRWRPAFQYDFAARIAWTLAPKYKDANHAPIAVLNGDAGAEPLRLTAKYGQSITLSAEGSRDPDKNAVTTKWWVYREAGNLPRQAKPVLSIPDPLHAVVEVPAVTSLRPEEAPSGDLHVILEVWDNGTPQMVSYRRAIITMVP